MATVMRLLIEDTDPRFRIRLVPTYVDSFRAAQLWTGIVDVLWASALVLSGKTDVLHVHYSLRGSIVRKSIPLFAARLRGVPAVVHSHSSHFFTWLDELPCPLRRLVREALRADYLVVLGRSHLEESRARLGFDETNTRVLYNPVVTAAVAPSPRTGLPVRAVSLGRLGSTRAATNWSGQSACCPKPFASSCG